MNFKSFFSKIVPPPSSSPFPQPRPLCHTGMVPAQNATQNHPKKLQIVTMPETWSSPLKKKHELLHNMIVPRLTVLTPRLSMSMQSPPSHRRLRNHHPALSLHSPPHPLPVRITAPLSPLSLHHQVDSRPRDTLSLSRNSMTTEHLVCGCLLLTD